MAKHKKKSSRERHHGEKRKSASQEEGYENLRKRLKQLEDELKQTRSQSNNGGENINSNKNGDDEIVVVDVTPLDLSRNNPSKDSDGVTPLDNQSPAPGISDNVKQAAANAANQLTKDKEVLKTTPQGEQDNFEDDVLEIIGKDPNNISSDLVLSSHVSARWKSWLKTGQKKEVKDALLQKYPRTGDCYLEAPTLNPEIKASLNEGALKRDKYFSITQNLAGSALSALSLVIDPLLRQEKTLEPKKMLEHLWNTSQLLTEIHRGQTVARKACIVPSLEKPIASMLEKVETEKLLFGDKLGEKIKESKLVSKISQEIKIQSHKKTGTVSGNLNSSGPSASRSTTQMGQRKYYSTPKSAPYSHRGKQTSASKQKNQHQSKPWNRK